jgi:hypothetical protein
VFPDDGQMQEALCGAYADGLAYRRGEREVRARGSCGVVAGGKLTSPMKPPTFAHLTHHSKVRVRLLNFSFAMQLHNKMKPPLIHYRPNASAVAFVP